MKCKWCNSDIKENIRFCPNCGGNIMELNQQTQSNLFNNVENEESPDVWLVIVSFLVPIAGLIIFLCNKDTKKKTAKASGIAALVSTGITIFITIIFTIVISMVIKNTVAPVVNGVVDTIETEIQDQMDSMENNNYNF